MRFLRPGNCAWAGYRRPLRLKGLGRAADGSEWALSAEALARDSNLRLTLSRLTTRMRREGSDGLRSLAVYVPSSTSLPEGTETQKALPCRNC